MSIRMYICTYETLKRVLFIFDLSIKHIGLVIFTIYTCMVDNMSQCLRDQHNITQAHIQHFGCFTQSILGRILWHEKLLRK